MFRPVEKYYDVDVETWIIPGKGANFPRGYEMYKGGQLVAKPSATGLSLIPLRESL